MGSSSGSGPGGDTVSAEPGGDAQLAIAQVTGWIVSADAKAGFLAALLSLLLGALSLQVDTLRGLLPPRTAIEWAVVSLAHLAAVALAVSVWYVRTTLVARSGGRSSTGTRYAWPALADADPASYVHVRPGQARAEAWQHAVDLAWIARAKYGAFRKALTSAVLAGCATGLLLILIAWR